MNKVFLVGRLAAEPQGSVTSTGNTVSRISLACQDSYSKDKTYFFPCVAFQNQAKFINTYIKKGDLVAIDGKLVRGSYVNKDGNNVYTTDVVIETIKIMSTSNRNNNANNYQQNKQYESNNYQENVELTFEDNSSISNNNSSENEIDSIDLD